MGQNIQLRSSRAHTRARVCVYYFFNYMYRTRLRTYYPALFLTVAFSTSPANNRSHVATSIQTSPFVPRSCKSLAGTDKISFKAKQSKPLPLLAPEPKHTAPLGVSRAQPKPGYVGSEQRWGLTGLSCRAGFTELHAGLFYTS